MIKDCEPLGLPDLVGYEVAEAMELLNSLGVKIQVEVTKPIFATEPIGGARIIRLKQLEDNSLQVVVAYQDYLKGGA